MSIECQEAERLAVQLEVAAKAVRAAIKPSQHGVFLNKGPIGYAVVVDGFDLGVDTSRSDADALCMAIATRRPPGDEMGYGQHYHSGTPRGMSSRDPYDSSTVTIGISVREKETAT